VARNTPTPWTVLEMGGVARWAAGLSGEEASRLAGAVGELQRVGPALGRPYVDSIKGSRHHNMKELRPLGGNLRVLFAFDRNRQAVLLVGGDKTNNWAGWYAEHIPRADRLFDQHQRSRGADGAWRNHTHGRGGPSRGAGQ
jgi:hypothetical protein